MLRFGRFAQSLALRGLMCGVVLLCGGRAMAQTSIGINLNSDDDFRTQGLWTNLADQFRGWYFGSGMTPDQLITNSSNLNSTNGYYPLNSAYAGANLIAYDESRATITIDYTYTGSGFLGFTGDAVSGTQTSTTTNGVTTGSFQYKPGTDSSGRGLVMQYIAGSPTSISGLQIYLPGTNLNNTLNMTAAANLAPFSTVRYMDLLQANNDVTTTSWASSTQDTTFIQNVTQKSTTSGNTTTTFGVSQGVSYSRIVGASNQLKNNLWITIPVNATSDYMTNLGKYLGDHLTQGQQVYVEYGNEMWNTGTAAGKQNFLLAGAHTSGLTANDYSLAGQEEAAKLYQISAALKAGYDSSSMTSTNFANNVSLMFGAYTDNTSANYIYTTAGLAKLAQLSSANNTTLASLGIKSLAISGYVDTGSASITSLNDVFAAMNAELATDGTGSVYNAFVANKTLASSYGLSLSVYEAGQSLLQSTVGSFASTAQTDPRMALIYHKLIQDWNLANAGSPASTTGPFMLYSYADAPTTSGAWGLLASGQDHGSVKWDAVLREMLKPGDANLDGKVNMSDFAILELNFGQSGKWWEDGNFNSGDNVNGVFTATATTVDAGDLVAMYQQMLINGTSLADLQTVQNFAASEGVLLPEPGPGVLLLIGAALLATRRVRRPRSIATAII